MPLLPVLLNTTALLRAVLLHRGRAIASDTATAQARGTDGLLATAQATDQAHWTAGGEDSP